MNLLKYYLKKALGLATYADEVAKISASATSTPGVITTVVKSVTAVFSSVSGTVQAAATATVTTITGGAIVGGTQVVAKIVTTTVILPTVAIVAGATSIEVSKTTVARSNQIRAVVTDTIRRPIDFDRAINPAYNNQRDALLAGKKKQLVARYMTTRGEDEAIPLIGYSTNIRGPKGTTTKKLLGQDDDSEFITASEVQLIVEEDEEAARARLFAIEQEQETFNRQVAGASSQTITTQVTQTFTDPGRHGIEFEFSLIRTRSVVTASIVQGHNTIIDILGTEEYVETFKAEAAQEAGVGYIIKLIRGETSLGPGSYVNSLSGQEVADIASNVLGEFYSRSNNNTPSTSGVRLDPKAFAISSSTSTGPTSYQVTSTNTKTRQVFSPFGVLDQLRQGIGQATGQPQVRVNNARQTRQRATSRTRSETRTRRRTVRRKQGLNGVPVGSLYSGPNPIN